MCALLDASATPVISVVTDVRTYDLEAGATLAFGRDVDADGATLHLADDPRIHRRCGHLEVTSTGWNLANDGRWLHLTVRSLDHPGHDELLPGDRRPIAWRRVRVEVPIGSIGAGFEVLRWGASERSANHTVATSGQFTAQAMRVNRSAGYFRALVALCEERLRDPSCTIVPSDAEVARRLNALDAEDRFVSVKAIERRFDYVREALGLKGSDGIGGAGHERRDARRRLVDVAVGTGTVTPQDLAVLDAHTSR